MYTLENQVLSWSHCIVSQARLIEGNKKKYIEMQEWERNWRDTSAY